MVNKANTSTGNKEWATPPQLFRELDYEFHFQLDACASEHNHKCTRYFSIQDDALSQDWYKFNSVFMNPPYGKQIKYWIEKAYSESQKGCTVVCLLPASTDTKWWHNYCLKGEVRFIKGRLAFGNGKKRALFPSAIVIFDSSAIDISKLSFNKKSERE